MILLINVWKQDWFKKWKIFRSQNQVVTFENSKKFSSSSLISEVDASYSSVRKKNFDMEWRVDIVD